MNILLFTVCATALTNAVPETVWLRDLNSDHSRRNFDGGLPESLNFQLSRAGETPDVTLQLKENKRLNENAPLFEVKSRNGDSQVLARKSAVPHLDVKFYHDMERRGAFQVTCEVLPDRPCQRQLTGHLFIDGRQYDIQPASNMADAPLLRRTLGVETAHVLTDVMRDYDKRTLAGLSTAIPSIDSRMPPSDDNETSIREEIRDILRELILPTNRASQPQKRQTNPTYALEILLVVDTYIWTKFYANTQASGGLNQNDATELSLRRHFSNIVNGMSLRYESIDDVDMNIYLTISGFIFYKTVGTDNPLNPSVNIKTKTSGAKVVNVISYLESITPWSQSLQNLPDNDHIAVFTDLDLTYQGNTNVAGMAWLGAVCTTHKTSINEDGSSYFATVTIAAHELGHNLGANHDGENNNCPANADFVMKPSVPMFSQGQAYSVNPWRFSQCSIDAFKNYVNSLSVNCLLDAGNYYNQTEYQLHVSTPSGQLHSVDQQCKLLAGSSSKLCENQPITDPEICRVMACAEGNNWCQHYSAAVGTPCGPQPQTNKWCFEGLCQDKPTQPLTPNPPPVTPAPGPFTFCSYLSGLSDPSTCQDTGDQGVACTVISAFFTTVSKATTDWCNLQYWGPKCCSLCKAALTCT